MNILPNESNSLINIISKKNPYFKSLSSEFKVFVDFENKFNSIYRYFYMNSYFLSQYFQEILSHSEDKKNFSKDIINYKEIHDMTILMIIFTDFESTLKRVTYELSFFSEKQFNSASVPLPYISIYLNFLQKKFYPNFKISIENLKFIDILRKIRNEYLHEGKSIIPFYLQKELSLILNKNHSTTSIDDFFLEDTFKIIGDIISCLQISYLLYHESFRSN